MKKYVANYLKLLEDDDNATLLMAFLGCNVNIKDSTLADSVICDDQSCVFSSLVHDGLIQDFFS